MEMRSTEDELLALSTLLASQNGKPARAGQAVSPQRFPRVDEVAFQGGEPGEPTWRQAPRTAVATAINCGADQVAIVTLYHWHPCPSFCLSLGSERTRW